MTEPVPPVVLVGCVKTKQVVAAPARDLYTSTLFRFRRAYAEAAGGPWYVLSAKHYLVAPDRVIAPYDLALSEQPPSYRASWGRKVAFMLAAQVPGGIEGRRVEIHAGWPYREAVDGPLRLYGADPVDPIEATSLGDTLAWYSRRGRP